MRERTPAAVVTDKFFFFRPSNPSRASTLELFFLFFEKTLTLDLFLKLSPTTNNRRSSSPRPPSPAPAEGPPGPPPPLPPPPLP
jgi:hypothetical protein